MRRDISFDRKLLSNICIPNRELKSFYRVIFFNLKIFLEGNEIGESLRVVGLFTRLSHIFFYFSFEKAAVALLIQAFTLNSI